jgi:DNA-binding IclR family transcriptional regulator
MKNLGVSRPTAKRYLDALVAERLLSKQKFGRVNYFINTGLIQVLTDIEQAR